MKVLVTGAGGFIGRHAVRALIGQGHQLTALIRPRGPGCPPGEAVSGLAAITGDIMDAGSYRAAVEAWRPEALLHLAWYTEPGRYLTSAENIRWLSASLILFETVLAAGCGRIVTAGTCAEYDISAGLLAEDGPTAATTLYGAAKISLCHIGRLQALAAGASFAWPRIFHLYGPGEDERRVLPSLILSLLQGREFRAGSGLHCRDYLHVEDVAEALAALIASSAGGIFNVSSAMPITMRALMEMVGVQLQAPGLIRFGALPPRDGEPDFVGGRNDRLRSIGWEPHRSLEDGIAGTIAWWKKRQDDAGKR